MLSLLVIPGFMAALAILFVARFAHRAMTPILFIDRDGTLISPRTI